VTSATVTGEPSRDTGSQQGEVVAAAATLRVLVPLAPSPGHGQARPESRPAVDREAAVNAADDDAPPGGAKCGCNLR
jgi:hypothetical protein